MQARVFRAGFAKVNEVHPLIYFFNLILRSLLEGGMEQARSTYED
ncbi:hypothetical protein ACFLV7_16000 [Chloroflexota bacterium]